jgi:SAM-dependent methyltransferase
MSKLARAKQERKKHLLCAYQQDAAFIHHEADAWFARNEKKLKKAGPALAAKDPTMKLLDIVRLPRKGRFLDLGGGNGRVSAGFITRHRHWHATVIEPSQKAIRSGRETFPYIEFHQGSVTKRDQLPQEQFDMVLIRGVLCWVDRKLLSQAIANIDSLVKNGGYLVVSDFYTPAPRANPYHYRKGLFTFKQDYVAPFLALNIYSESHRISSPMSGHTQGNKRDPYDVWWTDAVLRKDLEGRYRQS